MCATDDATCNTSGSSKVRSTLAAVNWVCDDALDDHAWVSEQTKALQEAKVFEALHYDIENPVRSSVEGVVVLCANQPRQ